MSAGLSQGGNSRAGENRGENRVLACALAFGLASLSFACLLGHMFGWWSMRAFAPCVLVPATIVLVALAVSPWGRRAGLFFMVWEGAVAGLVAAVLYDVFRFPFVRAGYPLFGVFPKFGQMLLYGGLLNAHDARANDWPAQLAGWTYHFSNGMALGVMFLALVYFVKSKPSPRVLLWSGAIWAVAVEVMLLLSPYYGFLGVDKKLSFGTFLALTLSAHLVFGVVLGAWCARRIPRRALFERAS